MSNQSNTIQDGKKMLTFESLLVKELQKQQSRGEFCDIVLQTQGVSVPVHSCVLTAFSPWLCGALSTMPSPQNGQKRLIEVEAVEACTLLSLVCLLYSGQFNEDREKVLSAACKLGINIPQPDTTAEGKNQESKAERAATEEKIGKQVGTQTEFTKEAVERECQTEVFHTAVSMFPSECSDPKETIQTVNVIDLSSWRTDQELCTYTTPAEISLTTLQNVQSIPEKLPFQVMNVVPETSMYPTVSASACAPQDYICPHASSSNPHTSYSTWVKPLANQGQSSFGGVSQGDECVLEGIEQFENNIPGFINHFLDATNTNNAGQRAQKQRGMRGDNTTGGRVRRARRARLQGACALRWEGSNITKPEHNRCGRVAGSVCVGQGGGRVGSMLDTRQLLKHQGRLNRRQGRGVMYRVKEERYRSSSRGRPRKRQAEIRGRFIEPACQDQAPPMKRQRGRPRKHPLPPPNVSQIGMSPSKLKVTNPPAPSLMHTAALPAANQTGLVQPMDWLIDDVIAQLPFMPPITSGPQNNPNGIMKAATLDSHPRTHTSVKLSDLSMVQPEGELTDILDSFLRTFDQHVATCDVDNRGGMPDGSQCNITDKTTNACQQYTQSYTVQKDITNTHTGNNSGYPVRTSSLNTTTLQGPTATLSQNSQQVSVHGSHKPSFSGKVPGVKIKKINGQPRKDMSENRRMTRSQSRKKKLKKTEEWPWKEKLPAKRQRQRRRKRLENKGMKEKSQVRQLQGDKKCTTCKTDSRFNVAKTPRKVIRVPGFCSVKCSAQSTKNIQKTLDRSQSSEWCGQKESCQSVRINTLTGSQPEKALSTFELMNILENQRKREEQKEDYRMQTARKQIESEKMLTTDAKSPQTRNQTASPQQALPLPKGEEERLIKNSHNKPTFDNVDLPNAATFQSTSSESSDSSIAVVGTEVVVLKDIIAMPHVSDAVDPDMPHEEPTQNLTDSSEEDVDVVEVSSSFTESSTVLPITVDIVPSTEDEDDEEEVEID